MGKKRILFICSSNSCRSQMAEGIVNHDFAGKVEAVSAGLEPKHLNLLAVKVLAEVGIDISQQRPDSLCRYEAEPFDYVITVCGAADEKCPAFFGGVKRLHLGFDNPPQPDENDPEVVDAYRNLRDEMRGRLGEFFREQLQN